MSFSAADGFSLAARLEGVERRQTDMLINQRILQNQTAQILTNQQKILHLLQNTSKPIVVTTTRNTDVVARTTSAVNVRTPTLNDSTAMRNERSSCRADANRPNFDAMLSDMMRAVRSNAEWSRPQYARRLYRAICKNADEAVNTAKLPSFKVQWLKKAVFERYPLGVAEDDRAAWRECVSHIDSFARTVRHFVKRGRQYVWDEHSMILSLVSQPRRPTTTTSGTKVGTKVRRQPTARKRYKTISSTTPYPARKTSAIGQTIKSEQPRHAVEQTMSKFTPTPMFDIKEEMGQLDRISITDEEDYAPAAEPEDDGSCEELDVTDVVSNSGGTTDDRNADTGPHAGAEQHHSYLTEQIERTLAVEAAELNRKFDYSQSLLSEPNVNLQEVVLNGVLSTATQDGIVVDRSVVRKVIEGMFYDKQLQIPEYTRQLPDAETQLSVPE